MGQKGAVRSHWTRPCEQSYPGHVRVKSARDEMRQPHPPTTRFRQQVGRRARRRRQRNDGGDGNDDGAATSRRAGVSGRAGGVLSISVVGRAGALLGTPPMRA